MITNELAKALSCAVWMDKTPTVTEKKTTGDYIKTTADAQPRKVLRTLGNYMIVENLSTKEQTIIHMKDATVLTNGAEKAQPSMASCLNNKFNVRN